MNATLTTPNRQRKPLQPVNVRAYFVGGATVDDVNRGAAVLSITDPARGDESPYWLEALYDGARCTGFRVRKFGGEEVHDVTRDLASCDCPDGTYRSERPGGCRHIAALRQALPTVQAVAMPAPARTHEQERMLRDEFYSGDFSEANANER